MANFTISISNSFNLFERASLWGFMTWGVDKWGYGSQDLTTATEKLITNTQDSTTDLSKAVVKYAVTNTLTLDSDATVIGVRSGIWDYVYTLPTTNNDLAAHTTYSSNTVGSQSWTCASVGSTVWS